MDPTNFKAAIEETRQAQLTQLAEIKEAKARRKALKLLIKQARSAVKEHRAVNADEPIRPAIDVIDVLGGFADCIKENKERPSAAETALILWGIRNMFKELYRLTKSDVALEHQMLMEVVTEKVIDDLRKAFGGELASIIG